METRILEQPHDSALDVHSEPTAPQRRCVLMPFSDADVDQIVEEWLRKRKPRPAKRNPPTPQHKFMVLLAKKAKQRTEENDEDESASSIIPGDSASEEEASPAVDNDEAIDEEPSDEDSDNDTLDADGEEKIDSNGYLLGGRSYICPVFRSPWRRNPDRLYIPATECCRFTGYPSTKKMFLKNRDLRQVRLTGSERDVLCDNLALSSRFAISRNTYMVRARSAFKVFGALLVKNGRHMVDDYCEANWQSRGEDGRLCVSGQVVANMEKYREWKANFILGRQPMNTTAVGTPPTRPPRVRMPKELIRYLTRPYPVVGSCAELMELVSERQAQRKAFRQSLQAGITPTLPNGVKVEIGRDRALDTAPIVIDDSSEGGESDEDDLVRTTIDDASD
ncbi:chromatin structure-remodeling complex subunit RSC7 [Coemansia furcata]|nr:chromatin structure-remodeling complex subunit RSC7 [Coemansia furcata]